MRAAWCRKQRAACTVAPRSLAPVSGTCCRTPCRSIPSGTGRRRGPDCSAEPCRHSSGARRSRCSYTRDRRRTRRRRFRPIRWCRHDRSCLRCRWCRPLPTRRLRRPAEDTRCPGSRQSSKRRCRARNRDTRLDLARTRHRRARACPSIHTLR